MWTRLQPPTFQPDAILTRAGWVHPKTGEILVCLSSTNIGPGFDLQHPIKGKASIQATSRATLSGASRILATGIQYSISGRARIKGTPIQQSIKGKARITCFVPFDRGINPGW